MALLKAVFFTILLFTPPWGWAALVCWGLYKFFKGGEVYVPPPTEANWESSPLPEDSIIGSKVK